MQSNSPRAKAALELLSVIGPTLCLVDCVVIPLLLAALPMIGVHHIYHGIGDQILLLLVLSICVPTVTSGFLKHKRIGVMVLMSLGFSLMFFANFIGHSLDETLHFMLTTLGSAFLIKANWDNRKLSRATCCSCHTHNSGSTAE